ncbi:von Willebrand factor type A domain-containing protein [Exophiala viscosa]|uniref:von Willebrand factor type A domain-containing protein n=1 Tax=Exophiala viscosa TaxID=2486360 RepID=UPI0021983EEC|nr:von Willebrand factor type A domain-containing protein [Exophiala viscosa]
MSKYSKYQNPCGCWYPIRIENNNNHSVERRYLPQVQLSSSTDILTVTSRTTLKQTFFNPEDKKLEEVHYTFPLYDGVSIAHFTCTIGAKTIVGVVKEKQQAKAEYQEAVARGETAGLLEQLSEASDVFTTSLGNIPPMEKVLVEIVYLGELKYDAEMDGSRFTIPTSIAPRYGTQNADTLNRFNAISRGGISITVNVRLEEGSIIRGIQSPSHPIAVTMGRTVDTNEDDFDNKNASATLTLGSTELDKDFIVVVLAKGVDTPRALLETHPTIPNQRAIMTTLVPKFNIPNISPEIVFVVDRSGSMNGKIPMVVAAMSVFLKSLPVGVKFNICSFGSHHSFLFKRSQTYDQSSLNEAQKHLENFDANYGGTEVLQPIKASVENRYNDLPLEVMLLTDGQVWNQQELFDFVGETENARFFTLGVGDGASSALVEGIARAGHGFSQFVGENEKIDKRVVRMLKAALTPHISDYTLTVQYDKESVSLEEDFEMVEATESAGKSVVTHLKKPAAKKVISLFNAETTEEPTNPPAGRYDHLPDIPIPKALQAPHRIPALFPFSRTTVYLVLGREGPQSVPRLVTLKATSSHGPLELAIPVQDVGTGQTIHQLAAKKAMHELEQGRGWIHEARDAQHQLIKTAQEGKWDLIVEREAVRLGVQFQIAGRWCSFMAVEKEGGNEIAAPPPDLEPSADFPGTGSEAKKRRRYPQQAQSFHSAPVRRQLASQPTQQMMSPPLGAPGSVSRCRKRTAGYACRSSGAAHAGADKSLPWEEAEVKPMKLDTMGNYVSVLSDPEKMHKVIALQAFDGSWNMSDELFELLGVHEGQMRGSSADDVANATALAIAWLKNRVAAEEDVWVMVVEKATGWLEGKLGSEEAKMAIDEAVGLL